MNEIGCLFKKELGNVGIWVPVSSYGPFTDFLEAGLSGPVLTVSLILKLGNSIREQWFKMRLVMAIR